MRGNSDFTMLSADAFTDSTLGVKQSVGVGVADVRSRP
jgi:hypothetical protein